VYTIPAPSFEHETLIEERVVGFEPRRGDRDLE
jgi:hypothetical protein